MIGTGIGSKVKIISHRGNIDSEDDEDLKKYPWSCYYMENEPYHCLEFLKTFPELIIELDVWKIGNNYYSGHDEPRFLLSSSILSNSRILFHAKNLEAYQSMVENNMNVFWHENDSYALTREGKIVVYPGKTPPLTNAIIMQPELSKMEDIYNAYAICTDFPLKWIDILWK